MRKKEKRGRKNKRRKKIRGGSRRMNMKKEKKMHACIFEVLGRVSISGHWHP